jgi:hypothetical protein
MLSSKIVKGAKLKVYPGAPHGLATTWFTRASECRRNAPGAVVPWC